MNRQPIVLPAVKGLVLGSLCGLCLLSPTGYGGIGKGSKVAFADNPTPTPSSCTRIQAAYTGSYTHNLATTLAGFSGNISVGTPTWTCDKNFDTWYWVGIEGASGSCGLPSFIQAGWVMLGVPTSFYEEFNVNDTPCHTDPMTGNNASGTLSYQVNASTSRGGLCPAAAITHFYVNGSAMGSVCSDWVSGTDGVASAEREEVNSRLANTTFSSMAYCTDDTIICTPSTTYSVTTTNSVTYPDSCGAYTWLGTSSFRVQDKRDLGQTC